MKTNNINETMCKYITFMYDNTAMLYDVLKQRQTSEICCNQYVIIFRLKKNIHGKKKEFSTLYIISISMIIINKINFNSMTLFFNN